MAVTRKFTVKFTQEQAEMLLEMAATEGVSISDFLRSRITAKENLNDAFGHLQSTVLAALREGFRDRPSETGQGSNTSPQVLGMLAEILLLLRGASNPGKMQAVTAEVQRLGYEPFKK